MAVERISLLMSWSASRLNRMLQTHMLAYGMAVHSPVLPELSMYSGKILVRY